MTDIQSACHFIVSVILIPSMLLLISCWGKQNETETGRTIDRTITIRINTNLIIGRKDQPFENQLGRPVAVRTDGENNIYIADQASLTIKVFDEDGNYIHSLGGRGRGPGEFLDISLMEVTPEGNFVFMDRGNYIYSILSKEGESIDTFPYNFSDQYYPAAIDYTYGKMIGLFLSAAVPSASSVLTRDLFHVYSTDFQDRQYSFAPFKQLGFEEMFAWVLIALYPGSFTLSEDTSQLIYSPGIYNGTLYVYRRQEDGRWEYDRTIQGVDPFAEPYQIYFSEGQYETAKAADEPGVLKIYYGEGPHMGKLVSMDAGIFYLEDGRIVHFIAEWRGKDSHVSESDDHLLDISVQIFDKEGKLQDYRYLFSIQRSTPPYLSLVNWKDKQDNFYLLELSEANVPTVQRFTLDLPE